MHDLPHLAIFFAIQAGKVGDATGRAHAAQKTVALDQQGARAVLGRTHAGGQTGWPATEHDHVVLAVNGQAAGGFGDE